MTSRTFKTEHTVAKLKREALVEQQNNSELIAKVFVAHFSSELIAKHKKVNCQETNQGDER